MKHPRFEAYFLPALIRGDHLQGAMVAMADILRASTTMIAALENGAATIWPHASIDSARAAAATLGDGLLCGERNGTIIEGFDFGNSPREYPPQTVAEKTMVHCTTNGTVALESCRAAGEVLIGAFSNLTAVVERMAEAEKSAVVCAGTHGEVTGEDVLFAGAVASKLKEQNAQFELNDQANIAMSYWHTALRRCEGDETLAEVLAECRGGMNLMELGFDQDVAFCAQVDITSRLPRLDLESWRIR